MAIAEPQPLGLCNVPADLYHADTESVSISALDVFARSPLLYHWVYNLGRIEREPPSAAMQLGSAFHAHVLEKERFADLVAIRPDGLDRRTKSGKEAWAEFEERSNGKAVIDLADYKRIAGMAMGIAGNPIAKQLLEAPGRNELSAYWTDKTEMTCRARFDRLLDCGIVLDLKTAADPCREAFSKACVNLGYHRRAAWYIDARNRATGMPAADNDFLFVVVGSSEPHECFVYELDPPAIELGRQQNRVNLQRLHECRMADQWESPGHGQVCTLSLPRWAYTNGSNQL